MTDQRTAKERGLRMPWERAGRPALTGPWWARGLRLDERIAAGIPDADPAQGGDLTAIADIRMERWRTAFAHIAADTVDLQCAQYGCTPRELRRLLAEPPEDLARRVVKPSWAEDVERLVAASADGVSAEADPSPDETWQRAFARILEPFTRESLRLFDAHTAGPDWHGVVDLETSREALRDYTAQRLLRLAVRVLVLELNVLRVTGRLDGGAPSERFRSFIRHYRRPDELAALLDEYAVLARLLITTVRQAAYAHAEALRRFVADRDLVVRDLFDGADPGILAAMRLGRGDTHAHGRSVGIAEFASGRQLVYKPRPVGLHRHFNDVLRWYGERLPEEARPRPLRLLDREEYGWVEFIEPADCADAAAANRYFFRQGALLTLLHCLAGVDFHFENLMAVGDQPVPIDLETIFCVEMPRSFGSAFANGDPALAPYRESVGRVGLLPAPLVGRDGKSFDAGGMGGDADAALPFPVVDWEDAGTDQMHVARVMPVLGRGHHRPRLHGVDLDALDYARPLLDGFRAGYRVLAASRTELPAADGPLAAFAEDSVRIIARPTHDYAVLLAETTHPDAMRDALDRDQVFGVLWARGATDPQLSRLARHEVEDLWAGDVPLFTTIAASRDLWTADGRVVEDLLPETGVARVRRTLAALGEPHLKRQLWIASAHLATRSVAAEPVSAGAGAVPAEDAGDEELCDRALALARAVADRLETSSYRGSGRHGWLGLDFSALGRWSVRPLGVDLYNGYPGVALFLAQLATVTGQERYAGLARGVLGPMTGYVEEQLSRRPLGLHGPPVELGAFTGLTGVALTFASCAVLLDDAALRAPVAPILEFAAARLRADEFDVVGGAAGALAVAESLSGDYGQPARRLADSCVKVLLSGAVADAEGGDGLAWPGPSPRPLLGFSHGVAGIAWALSSYARRTADAEAGSAALRASRHEHAAYDEQRGNWLDHRVDPPTEQYTWCHGAPGIGLARAASLAAGSGTSQDTEDLRRALDATARHGGHANHSLCHGELGNLELFAAARTVSDPRVREQWRRRAAAVVARIERDGPVCGTPGGVPTPGLMAGLAGIGHGLLRIAAADRVPPALLLAASTRD